MTPTKFGDPSPKTVVTTPGVKLVIFKKMDPLENRKKIKISENFSRIFFSKFFHRQKFSTSDFSTLVFFFGNILPIFFYYSVLGGERSERRGV